MRELLNFFVRNSRWPLLVIYLAISTLLLVKESPYHQHVYLTSASAVSASVYRLTNSVTSYFNLRDNNEDLNRRNADLQLEVLALQQKLSRLEEALTGPSPILGDTASQYALITAHVINNSVMKPHNYITINRGSNDGLKPEMGVIDQNGVVGIVGVVGKNNSRLISLLNPNFRLSCKIKTGEGFGSLVWNTGDPRYATLEELPRHTTFNRGDTVVTSGYSAVFPPGLPVGIVDDSSTGHNENFFSLRVRLLSDFTKLNNVQVVTNYQAPEIREIEALSEADDEKK